MPGIGAMAELERYLNEAESEPFEWPSEISVSRELPTSFSAQSASFGPPSADRSMLVGAQAASAARRSRLKAEHARHIESCKEAERSIRLTLDELDRCAVGRPCAHMSFCTSGADNNLF